MLRRTVAEQTFTVFLLWYIEIESSKCWLCKLLSILVITCWPDVLFELIFYHLNGQSCVCMPIEFCFLQSFNLSLPFTCSGEVLIDMALIIFNDFLLGDSVLL